MRTWIRRFPVGASAGPSVRGGTDCRAWVRLDGAVAADAFSGHRIELAGNGWAYLAIVAGALVACGWRALPMLAVGALNVGLLHCLYPSIKRMVARPRPYQCDGTLVPLLCVLDE